MALRASSTGDPSRCSQSHIDWVTKVLERMETIKTGSTRKALLTVFTTEGGLSTGLRRTFVSQDCPYFKVDVEFKAVGRPDRDEDGRVTLGEAGLIPYPEPPQFPIGTRMALVRQMVLISSSGNPMRTHLTESVQMRVYRAIHFDLGGTGTHSQDFFEFRVSREGLFSGHGGGLRPIVPGEKNSRFSGRRETTCSRVRGRSRRARRVLFCSPVLAVTTSPGYTRSLERIS
jgi:hypothetical protein